MRAAPDFRAEPGTVSEAYFRAASAVMAARPDHDGAGRTADLLARHYGIAGEIVPLASEIERTDELRLADGRRLILKTSTRPEAQESFAFQSATLARLEVAGDVIAPRVVPTRSGESMFRDAGICGYLQTRLDGRALHEAPRSSASTFGTGQALARLDLALAGCDPPGARRPVLWHVGCWPRLRDLADHLPAAPAAGLVRAAMSDYLAFVAPRLADLDWQITHNDPSPHNMLATGAGTGFIDFGDGGWNPRLQDLAIAAGHMVTERNLPLGGAEALIAGYHSVIALSELDRELLVGLMRARQAALILVNAWRSHLFPEDAVYINKNVARAERGLAILSRLDTGAATAAVGQALTRPPPDP